ncbi:thioredoxin family protein [Candidatus Woesearchaeota archaeon]|nr:thioredoxin family protein [Candidatus Woesearchaeota archaeon]
MNYKKALSWAFFVGIAGAAFVVSTPEPQVKEQKKINIVEITKENMNNYKNIAIYFYTPDCKNCAFVEESLETVAEKYQDRLTFGKTDFKNNQELTKQFHINSHPTVIFFKDCKETERTTGRIDTQELEDIIQTHYITQ